MSSLVQRPNPMGIPLRINDTTRLVTGLTKQTTCSDVIKMALKKTGSDNKENHYMYYMLRSSNGSESSLSERSRILSVLKHSADKKMKFILRKRKSVSITKEGTKSFTELPVKRQCGSRLKFNSSVDDRDVKLTNFKQHKDAEKSIRSCQEVTNLAKFIQSQMSKLTKDCDADNEMEMDDGNTLCEPNNRIFHNSFSQSVLIDNTSDFFDASSSSNSYAINSISKINREQSTQPHQHNTPTHKLKRSLPFKQLSKISRACLRTPSYKMEKRASSNRFHGLQRRNSLRRHETLAQLQESQHYYDLSSTSICADSASRDLDTTEDASTSMNNDMNQETNFVDRFLMDKRFKRQVVSEQLNRKFVDFEHIRSDCLDDESFIENPDEFMDNLDEFKRFAKQRRERVKKDSADSVHMEAQSVNVNKNVCREESSKSTSSRVRRTDTFNEQKDGEEISDYIKRIFTKSIDLDEDDYMESFMSMC